MDKASGKLTVYFEEPFWVGVFERIEDGKLSVAKVTFGAEPKDYEVQEYIQKYYFSLKFSPTVETVVIHLPDFNDKYVFSKKKSNTSNAEYKKQIAEQAYEDFKNGQFQNKSEGFNKLMKKYTSEVSPDRKGIITSGLKAVSRNKQSGLKPIDLLATILEGKVKYQRMPSGQTDYIEFYDKNGEMVATYSNNGWTMYTTNAEAARQTEMCMIYNEAWGNAKRGIPLTDSGSVNSDSLQNVFDVRA